MENIIQQPRWKKMEYTRKEIENAGEVIKKSRPDTNEYKNAIKVIDNWRAAHAYPLHIIYMHLRRTFSGNADVIVAERLKRLDSITKKLMREKGMSLWRMQDLGGCRVVLPTIDAVYLAAAQYEKSRKRHIQKREYDYIKDPKSSGYRSLHVVYQYHSDTHETYNKNMLVEIQYRTHLQHLWATAVETMGLFKGEAIKSGEGTDDVKQFFVLVSALFAKREKQPLPPDVVDDEDEIISEIESLNAKNNYLDFLSGIRVAVEYKKENDKYTYYMLILDYNTHQLKIIGFKSSQIETANDFYNFIESTSKEKKKDAVLVRVKSFKDLQRAYPNYFSDIKEFVDIVKSYLN